MPHASAAKFPLHESVLKDARGYRVRQYRMVESRRYDEAALATADAGARRSGKITLATAKAIVKSVEDGGARWGVTQTEIDTIRFVMNGGGGAYAYETQPAARKFLEEFAAKAEGQAAAAAAAAPSVVKAKARGDVLASAADGEQSHAARGGVKVSSARIHLKRERLYASSENGSARTVIDADREHILVASSPATTAESRRTGVEPNDHFGRDWRRPRRASRVLDGRHRRGGQTTAASAQEISTGEKGYRGGNRNRQTTGRRGRDADE